MKDLMLSEKLMAKHAYECFLALLRVDSKAYHADNGRFADKGFRDDCVSSNQTITFCGVGSHHQNGIAERKIKDITLCSNFAIACKTIVSRVHFDYSLAICCQMLRGLHESFGSSCRWTNAFQNSCKSRLSTAYGFRLSHLWLSMLCLGSLFAIRAWSNSEMGASFLNGHLRWTFSFACF